MEANIAGGAIGTVGKFDVVFKDGVLIAEADVNAGPGSAGLVIKLDSGKVLDALAAAIPGAIDDAVFGVIKAALLAK